MKMNNTARSITAAAIVGAAYAALTMLLAPISYGAIQVRVSEALCILPYFLPCTAWGLFAGCAIANVLLAAVLTAARLGQGKHTLLSEFLACSANVVINAVVIGAVITEAYNGQKVFAHPEVFALNALYIFLGEAAVMYLIGLPLMRYLPGKKFFRDLIEKFKD